MFSKMMKLICILICMLVFVACDDDDHVSGDEKPANDPNDYSFEEKDTPISHDYKFEEYANGDVATFHWSQTLAWFLPNEKHIYGFDMDPYAIFDDEEAALRGRDVYMSVPTGEKAVVNIQVDFEAKKQYRLRKIDKDDKPYGDDVVSGSDACAKGRECIMELSLPAGDYVVYYGDERKERYLHIKPYNPDLHREVFFVEFGKSDKADCLNEVKHNGCYTKDEVEKHFDKVMSQVVVGADFQNVSPSSVGFDEGVLVVDLTKKPSEEYNALDKVQFPVVRKIYTDIALKSSFGYSEEYSEYKKSYEKMTSLDCWGYKEHKDDYNSTINQNRSALETALNEKGCTLNEIKKIFECPAGSDESVFEKLNEKYGEWYGLKEFVKNEEERCSSPINDYKNKEKSKDDKKEEFNKKHLVFGINEMRILWSFDGNGKNIILNNYRVFQNACQRDEKCKSGSNELSMNMKSSCSGGSVKTVRLKAAKPDVDEDRFEAIISGGENKKGCKYDVYADVYPFVPDPEGAAQVTLSNWKSEDDKTVVGGFVWGSHLVGKASYNTIVHEIGHSFGLTDLYVMKDDPTDPKNYEGYGFYGSDGIFYSKYKQFTFDESNLMNYQSPNGMRLRYRPLAVCHTLVGGLIFKEGKSIFETERQWDCIRSSSDCYKE